MQNISYVLQIMGKKWLTGLKPAKNVGANIAVKIEKLLLHELGEAAHSIAEFEIGWRDKLEKLKKNALQTPSEPPGKRHPSKIESKTSQYQRDQEVKAWVIWKANGKCECCCENSPFIASDGFPYLETHHVIWLNEDGPDTISNTVAVCPNCHRELHYGEKRNVLKKYLYKKIPRLLAQN